MKFAYFDTIAGISGDMALGAFVNAGLSFDTLVEQLRKLNLPGFELQARHLERNGIVATKVDVVISEQPKYHRHLKDIHSLIDSSSLSQDIRDRAKKIFHEIAIAEAKVHNTSLEKVHFHEVGAIDSLVDIVGVSICLEHFGIQSVYSSPVKVGSGGLVNSQHGILPVPTPATMEILKGYPTVLTDIPYELTTPTGAAIVKACSSGVLDFERLRILNIGYGAGTREVENVPNLLRVVIGELEPLYDTDELVSIESNIDDLNPELYPYVIERLLSGGARDAYLVPVVMKKGRPGIVLSVLVDRVSVDAALRIVFRETSTLGVRIHPVERRKLARSVKEISTSLGTVRVKAVDREGKETLIPEFESCKSIAVAKGIPLIDVYRTIEKELNIKN